MKKSMLSVLVLGTVLAMGLPRIAFAQSNTEDQSGSEAAATEQDSDPSAVEAGESTETEDGEPVEGEEEGIVVEEEAEPEPRIGTTWKRILIGENFTITVIIRTGSGEETITIEEALPEQIVFEVVGPEIVDEEAVAEEDVTEEGVTEEGAAAAAQASESIQDDFRPDETVTQGVVPDQPIIVESSGPDMQ